MKRILQLLFGVVFVWMAVTTIRAGLSVSLWEAWPSFAANPWAVATLYDAYFAFLTFYVWVAYKEDRMSSRILWFVCVMGLGSIAMSLSVLIQLARLGPDEPIGHVLWRKAR